MNPKPSSVKAIMNQYDQDIDEMLEDARGIHETVAAMDSDIKQELGISRGERAVAEYEAEMEALESSGDDGSLADEDIAEIVRSAKVRATRKKVNGTPVDPRPRRAAMHRPIDDPGFLQVVGQRMHAPQIVEVLRDGVVIAKKVIRPGVLVAEFDSLDPGVYTVRRLISTRPVTVKVAPGRGRRVRT